MIEQKPRTVTVVIDSLLGGGAERVAVYTASGLDSRKYLSHLLVTRHAGPLEQVVREEGVDHTILWRRKRYDGAAFLRARAIARRGDIIHSHGFGPNIWGALLSRATGRPLVAHQHTGDTREHPIHTLAYRFLIAPTAHRIVCVSEPVAASLIDIGVSPRLVEVVPNGVPIDDVSSRTDAREELGLRPSGTVVGMIGGLRPEKRHELALEAVALLRSQGQEITLCCIGGGERLEELRSLGESLGLGEHVVWAGERTDARRLVSAFDVTVLCSDFEGMPLAALESLVAGVPVVATAVGSLPELLSRGGGTLVRPDDVPALAAAISAEIAGDDSQKRAEARAYAQERFGADRYMRDIQRIYDGAFERSSPGQVHD
jgi:glycosyltransferase involved in cell wall biosynthesis